MPGGPSRGSSDEGSRPPRRGAGRGQTPRPPRPDRFTDSKAHAKGPGKGVVRPGSSKPTPNQDRIAALRKNREDALQHAKDMVQRMGIAPAPKRAVPKGKKASAIGLERLHVRIARAGLCSRRAAEQLILEGRVSVNDQIVAELGFKVGPEDEVRVDGIPIHIPKQYTVVLNKPTGIVTTMNDPQGRPTIVRFLPDYGVPLKPVGRLDMDTEGLLLCTNDGELANRLAHPRYGVEKEYQAIVKGIPSEEALERLRTGVFVEGRKTAPAQVEVIHAENATQTTGLRITIHEGRKRQIRIMCETVGHLVISLKRTRYGPLRVKGMRAGEARLLGQREVEELRALVGLE